MRFLETKLKGAYTIEPDLLEDDRGFFARVFCREVFSSQGLCGDFVQCSVSFNRYRGTLRGLHYQQVPHGEVKIVRCTMGAIWDVIVDLRRDSPTFLKWTGVELSAENRRLLYVPKNFAHGFVTLTDNAEVYYQITPTYVPGSAAGLRFDDPALGIEWPLTPTVVSRNDREFPLINVNVFSRG